MFVWATTAQFAFSTSLVARIAFAELAQSREKVGCITKVASPRTRVVGVVSALQVRWASSQ
jgi:hypothetical protein